MLNIKYKTKNNIKYESKLKIKCIYLQKIYILKRNIIKMKKKSIYSATMNCLMGLKFYNNTN